MRRSSDRIIATHAGSLPRPDALREAWNKPRISAYANVVGRENLVAGTDCGLGGRVHPQIVGQSCAHWRKARDWRANASGLKNMDEAP